MKILQATALRFAYAAKAVVSDVTFAARRGEMVGIIGPNGAGKSTLLRLLAGLLHGEGEVCYDSVALATLSLRQRARKRAFVAQQAPTQVPYTVQQMLDMGLAHHHGLFFAPHAPQRAAAALCEVGFAPAPQRLFTHLSGGERQLVLVARALLQDTPLLLLDEPQSNLDLHHRAAVMAALRRRARAGSIVVLSLHDLNLAALVCDRLVLLQGGRVYAEGTAAQVLRADILADVYKTPVVCGHHPKTLVPTVELDPTGWA